MVLYTCKYILLFEKGLLNMNTEEKYMEIFKYEDLVKKVINMETKEDVKKELQKMGIELNNEEIDNLGDAINSISDKLETLSDEELKEVTAGGGIIDARDNLAGWYKDTVAPAWAKLFPSSNGGRRGRLENALDDSGVRDSKGAGTTFARNSKDWASATMIVVPTVVVSAVGGIIYGIGKKAKWWGK